MNEKWINNLRTKMDSHQESEPLGLWDDIEGALSEIKPAPIINRRKVLLWSSIGAIAAMLTLIFILGRGDSLLITTPTNTEYSTAKQEIQETNATNKKSNKIIQEIEDKKALLASNTPSYNNEQTNNNKRETFVTISDKEEMPKRVEDKKTEEIQKIAEKDSDSKQTKSSKDNQSELKEAFAKGNTDFDQIDNYNYRKTSNNSGKLTASLYSTNLPNSTGESSGYGELIARTTLPKQMSANKIEEQSSAGDIIFSNIGEQTHTNTEHKQPVKAGLSIRYQLNNKFGVESGLTYTYLSSNLTSGTDRNLYETEQSLQYIGLPLNIIYDIWNNKQLSFYVSSGGLVEKCIAGKSHTDFIINNKIVETNDETVKEKPFQLSVNSAVGVQYNMTSKLGVFAEPGLGYYFDNGSDIETIYKEKPFNLNLKLGVRLNIN